LTELWIMLAFLVALLLTGMPIAFVLGIAATAAVMFDPAVPAGVVALSMTGGVSNFPLVAIILFMLTGEIMNKTSIAERLIGLANALVGSIRGGLAHVNIMTSLLFSEISGTATADAAAIGSIMIPQMKRRGFPVTFAAAVTATSATMAILMPPSLNLILYGVIAEVSIAQMFAAGVIPSLLVAALLTAVAYMLALRNDWPREERFSVAALARGGRRAALPMIIPVIILGGILGGLFTPSEAGALAVIAALVIGVSLDRGLAASDLWDAFLTSAKRTAMILFIVATSSLLGFYMTRQGIPQEIAQGILSLTDNYWALLALINIFFLLAGMIIHGTPSILLLVPIFLPLADELGIDRIHFGMIITMNLGIGQQTPPVASVLLIVCSIAKLRIMEILPYLSVFLAAMLVALILVTVFPTISLFLPSVLF
jgi:tripartite ATP-independent transporter DctM subunit